MSQTDLISVDPLLSREREKIFPIYLNSKIAFINRFGKIVIRTQFDYRGRIYEGMIPVGIKSRIFPSKERWGYMNEKGQMIVKLQFDDASFFSDGLAMIVNNGKRGYIDKTGKMIIKPKFDMASGFVEGLALVGNSDFFKVEDLFWIDKTGRRQSIEAISSFSEGLSVIVGASGYCYIDKTGKVVIKPCFKSANSFSEGLASVMIGKKVGFIDKIGKIIVKPQYERVKSYSEGLAAILVNKKWGFIDKSGKIIVNPQYEQVERYSEGLAAILVSQKWGFIDKTEKIIIKPQFSEVTPFRDGLASISQGVPKPSGFISDGYINETGKIIFKTW